MSVFLQFLYFLLSHFVVCLDVEFKVLNLTLQVINGGHVPRILLSESQDNLLHFRYFVDQLLSNVLGVDNFISLSDKVTLEIIDLPSARANLAIQFRNHPRQSLTGVIQVTIQFREPFFNVVLPLSVIIILLLLSV